MLQIIAKGPDGPVYVVDHDWMVAQGVDVTMPTPHLDLSPVEGATRHRMLAPMPSAATA